MAEMALQELERCSNSEPYVDEPVGVRVQAACRKMGVSRSTIYQLMAAGKLRSVKIAGRRVIPFSEIKRLVAEGA